MGFKMSYSGLIVILGFVLCLVGLVELGFDPDLYIFMILPSVCLILGVIMFLGFDHTIMNIVIIVFGALIILDGTVAMIEGATFFFLLGGILFVAGPVLKIVKVLP